MSIIDIKGTDKAQVLLSLYQNSDYIDKRYINDRSIGLPETTKMIEEEQFYSDYLNGRVIKIDLSGDTIDTKEYDKFNGEGSAEAAINHLLN